MALERNQFRGGSARPGIHRRHGLHLRQHRRWLAGSILVVALGLFVAASMSSSKSPLAYNLPEEVVIESVSLSELQGMSAAATPPIESGADAIRHAIHLESARLGHEQLNIYPRWRAVARLIHVTDQLPLWKVEVTSSGVIPSFGCVISFTRDGKRVPADLSREQCGYNK